MSQIAYDPVKDRLAVIIRKARFLRTLFFVMLDIFFLRSWHVRRTMKNAVKQKQNQDEKKPFEILDAGSGFGQYDRFMLRSFPDARIKAVDVKDDYLDDCRAYFARDIKNGRIAFENQDLLNYTDPGKDAVLCVDVLEHIEEDTRVMKNLFDSLNPGGFLVMHSPSHLAEDDAGDDDFFVDEHARAGYSIEELTGKLESAGFRNIRVRYTYGRFGHAAWVLMIKWPMLLINRAGFWTVVLLPFWYLLVFLPSMLLNFMDLHAENESGTGILALAYKSSES